MDIWIALYKCAVVLAVCAATLTVLGDYSLRRSLANPRGPFDGFWGFMSSAGILAFGYILAAAAYVATSAWIK
jgi:hypothetical protein